jgi:hypothetical protein
MLSLLGCCCSYNQVVLSKVGLALNLTGRKDFNLRFILYATMPYLRLYVK